MGATTLVVAIGTTISSFWILALNSWMHTPAGHVTADGALLAPEERASIEGGVTALEKLRSGTDHRAIRAATEAPMMFVSEPTVAQTPLGPLDSMITRVRAAVAASLSRIRTL